MLYKEYEDLKDRENLPLNGFSNYRVIDDKIITKAVEINAVRHCNLSCRSCSHSAPISSKQIYDSEILERDLKSISKYLHCDYVRLLGGEPLLHPNLLDILKIIKKSEISEKTCLVTNGLLLSKLTDEMLQFIDKIEISLYPLPEIVCNKIKQFAQYFLQKGIKVNILEYSDFRESITKFESDDYELINLIYNSCQIAHNWRCITIDNGRVYRCPQSMIYCESIGDFSDSLDIHEISNFITLLSFFENNNSLKSCGRCLGSVGVKFSHEQIPNTDWFDKLPNTPEDGIDREYAQKLIRTTRYESDCFNRKRKNNLTK